MTRLYLFLILFYSISFVGKAQTDTEFWFAAPEVTSLHADRPVYLRLSALDKNTSITISQPANPSFSPITKNISANSTISIDLTAKINFLENKPDDTILKKGILIKSTAEITAYYEVLGSSFLGVVNSDIFVLKGKKALGNEFYTPFQNYWDNFHGTDINAWSSFDIVATEDNTIITITPSNDIYNHPKGLSYTVNLNKGETYSARALSQIAAEHLSGTHITSNKPIAVTIKDDSIYQGQSYDLVGDQLIPVNMIGTEYIIIEGSLEVPTSDRVFICATQDNTDIFFNGSTSSTVTINTGQTYQYVPDTIYSYFKTSAPCYVFHVTGFYDELGGAIVPPISCTGSRSVGFTRSTDELFALSIAVRTGGEKYFKLNGNSNIITPGDFSEVPGTSGAWMAARKFLDESVFPTQSYRKLTNDSADFHLGVLNGYSNTGFRYGYFSDFAGVELGPDQTICKGEQVTLDAGAGKSSYLWSNGLKVQSIVVTDSAKYSVSITKGGCTQSDEIKIKFFPPSGKILGNDTTLCPNTGFQIVTQNKFKGYKWSNGSTNPNISPNISDMYSVTVTDSNGCKHKDTIIVNLYPTIKPSIIYNQDLEKICWDELIQLEVKPSYKKYKWNNGDTTKSNIFPHIEDYSVVVTDINNCKDSVAVNIDCSPYVKTFNLFTPDRDGHNEGFIVENLKPGKWTLEIYNRWGGRVYYNKSYNNDFFGDGIEDGLYYFVLKHNAGKRTIKSWVQVLRKDQ